MALGKSGDNKSSRCCETFRLAQIDMATLIPGVNTPMPNENNNNNMNNKKDCLKTCPECGADLTSASPVLAMTPTPTPMPTPTPPKKGLFGLGLFGGLLGGRRRRSAKHRRGSRKNRRTSGTRKALI